MVAEGPQSPGQGRQQEEQEDEAWSVTELKKKIDDWYTTNLDVLRDRVQDLILLIISVLCWLLQILNP